VIYFYLVALLPPFLDVIKYIIHLIIVRRPSTWDKNRMQRVAEEPCKSRSESKICGPDFTALKSSDPQLRMQIPVKTDRLKNNQIGLVSSGRSGWLVLLVAIAAVHRPGAIGLEGNLTRLSALCAGGIVHLSWAAAKAASVAASISFHLNSLTFVSTQRIDICHKNISVKNPLNRRQCSRLPMLNPDYIPVGRDAGPV
jgi:hypothetical protein